MSDEGEIKEILKELIIDEKEVLKQLVKKAKNIIGITSESGEIIIQKKEQLSIPELIEVYAIGKYFAYKLGMASTPAVQPREIANKFNIKENVVRVRCSELKKEGTLTYDDNGYQIYLPRINEILDKILSKIKS